MAYVLGLDVGTTYTAAAVLRRDGRPEVVQLGTRAAAMPSVVFLHDDAVLTGDAAVRRGLREPDRVGREFKRRIGDPAPILLGGVPLSAETLFARVLRRAVDVVTDREGGPPDRVAVCHPANWGPYKLELLEQACRIAELESAVTITEPEAAALEYAALERIEPGAVVAVYDLGGGTFDAAVLRKTEHGFEIAGSPEGIERLGGIDFDEAVVSHVRAAIHDELAQLDLDEPGTVLALARLRQECVEAKEALSADVETSIPVVLPNLQTEVRLTRAEFEAMIRVPLLETIAALRRALRSASVEPEELTAVLLVGGSSRIPMVAELVGVELRRPVAVDADPKHVVALGAARAALAAGRAASPSAAVAVAARKEDAVPPAAVGVATSAMAAPGDTTDEQEPVPAPLRAALATPAPTEQVKRTPAPTTPPPAGEPVPPANRRSRRLMLVAAALAAAAALFAVAAAVVVRGGGFEGWTSPCPGAGDAAACITSISYDDDRVVAEFTTHDLDVAERAFGRTPVGTVFFLAAVTESQAPSLVARGRTNAWLPWSVESPFAGSNEAGQRGLTVSDLGDDATALCVLLGDSRGRVMLQSGNCAELPPRR